MKNAGENSTVTFLHCYSPVRNSLLYVSGLVWPHHMSEFIQDNQLPFGIVINQSERIKWLTEKIIQIPATYL